MTQANDEPFRMTPVSLDDPAVRQLTCLPLPFAHWQGDGEARTLVPDPQVYLHDGMLYAHPHTMQRHGLNS